MSHQGNSTFENFMHRCTVWLVGQVVVGVPINYKTINFIIVNYVYEDKGTFDQDLVQERLWTEVC